ncbi:MAG: cohesin domain-containing protein [Pseudomonadota bacterium]
MIKIISFLLFLALSATCFAGVISVVGPGTSPAVADTFTINIQGTGIVDLYAFQFDLSFDPTLLAANATTQGTLLAGSGGFLPGVIDNISGDITFIADTLSGLVSGVTGDGTLAAISFTALAPGTSAITLNNFIFLDSNLTDITETIENGIVTVAEIAMPEPPAVLLFCVGLLPFISKRRLLIRISQSFRTTGSSDEAPA